MRRSLITVVFCLGALAAGIDAERCPIAISDYACGQDGITYQHPCLAEAQGVKVARRGRCEEQRTLFAEATPCQAAASSSPGPHVTRQQISRFAAEGFRLAGTANRGSFRPTATYTRKPATAPQKRQQQQGGATLMSLESILPTTSKPTSAVRMTASGLLYYLAPAQQQAAFMAVRSSFMAASVDGEDMPGFRPVEQQQQRDVQGQPPATKDTVQQTQQQLTAALLLEMMTAGRRLLSAAAGALGAHSATEAERLAGLDTSLRQLRYIIGKDDRSEIAGSPRWPFTAIGHILYDSGSCTGVMISQRAVLTAGHCVFNRKKGIWQQRIIFVPARHRKGNKVVEPFGRVGFDSVTAYSGWIDNANTTDAMRYDVAVIRLANESLGLATGWLGVTWDKRGYKGEIYSVGYPGDKMRGTQWMSRCNVSDSSGSDSRFVNACDVWPGQSGSPMLEWRLKEQYYMRAVLSYESCKCCSPDCRCCHDFFNGGCAINALHYQNILKWR